MDIKVSLFASAVRPALWPAFFKSLEGTSIAFEIVFAGNAIVHLQQMPDWKGNFTYIQTGNIKPAQCYEIARRACRGEVIIWCADDCLFSDDVIGKAYNFWKNLNNEKAILSMITKERYDENYFLTDLNAHTLRGKGTPLMAPIGMMSREYLERLGGTDRRYICGQYENDIVMRIYEDGGELIQYTECPLVIDHFVGHGGVTTAAGYARPFAQGYPSDRQVLETSWIDDIYLKVSNKRLDAFEPYEDKDLLTKSQSNNIPSMWV